MSKLIKIGVYGASPYNGNKGVVALSYSTVLLLDKKKKKNKIDYNLFLIHGDEKHNEEEFIKIENNIIKFKSIEPINISSIRSFVRFLISPKQWLSILSYMKFDILLNVGGGDSFSDIYGTKRFKSINSQYHIARYLNIPSVLMPQTIGPFKNLIIKDMASKSLERATLIMARDTSSFDLAKKLTDKEVYELLDVAFFLPYKKISFNPESIHVGINVSALCWNGGYTRDNQFDLLSDYQELTLSIIDNFLSKENVIIHLIPHVVHEYNNIENDYEICLELFNKYNNSRLLCAPFFLDPVIAKNYISGLDFFTGARMHSAIAAFSSGVPTVPLAYSRKFDGLFNKTLKYKILVDMKTSSIDDIIQILDKAFEDRQTIKLEINQILTNIVVDRKKTLFTILENIILKNV